MRYLFLSFILSTFALCVHSFATTINDVLPLRACAQSVSKLIDGKRIVENWSSDDENSFYFLNCDDDYDKGQDHYVFTPNGIYYFFIKPHKDYKGGLEGTQFRLTLENKTYYFKSNIAGGLGELFDQFGKNLSPSETNPEYMSMDPSARNEVTNFYMKVLTGKGDVKSSIIAIPVNDERLLKAQACIQKEIFELSRSLVDVYNARSDYQQVSSEVLLTYKNFVQDALSVPACKSDPIIDEKLNSYLSEMHLQ